MSLVDAVCRDAPVTDQAGLRGRARGAGIYALSVHRDIADAREAWLQLEQCAETTIYQTYRWAHLWQKHLGARSGFEPAIVIGRDENAAPAFLLPMAIVRRGPFRILQWLGDQSSVYGMGLFTNHAANALDGDGFKPVWEAVLSALPPVDLVALRNIPATWRGCPNPMRQIAGSGSVDPAYLLHLEHDYETLYRHARSGSTRRRNRRRDSKLEHVGTLEFSEVHGQDGFAGFIDTAAVHKNEQLAEAGIRAVFDDAMKRFFLELQAPDDAGETPLRAHALRCDGEIIAGEITALHRGAMYGIMMSMKPGALEKYSPGDYAFRHLVAAACADDLDMIDLGLGYASYKLAWANEVIELADAVRPTGLRGMAPWLALRGFALFKRVIKRSRGLWRLFKRVRRLSGSVLAPFRSQRKPSG